MEWNKKTQERFEEWYKKFLAEPMCKEERHYLWLFKKDSKEGKNYVAIQKEHLKRAFRAGWKAGDEFEMNG